MNINPKMLHISEGEVTLETPRTKLNSFEEDVKNLERLDVVV